MSKRPVEIIVISDVHLGTRGCHAKELLTYLKSIKPKKVILNGDIIDIWQFNKRYWPKSHMKVLKHIMGWIAKGIEVVYIPGNHDETIRKFVGFELGTFQIENKLKEKIGQKTAWVFHGDVFDVTMQRSKWLAKLGAVGYDLLILINRFVNFFSIKLGYGKLSFSQKIKNSVKSAVKHINCFEDTAADIAISKGYDYVICGHIHQPIIRQIKREGGSVLYLNSGDWIENLTSLEYDRGEWSIYYYKNDIDLLTKDEEEEDLVSDLSNKQLFNELLKEFQLL